jgi:murein DD-endopeptidase MepM/ murein hydrolase activator NlpD
LAAIDPITHLVQIYDPNGKVIAQIQATSTWPVRGKVTTEFGAPDPPYQKHHTGFDIAYRVGEPITTFMEGTVLKVENNPDNSTGYGKYVLVGHSNNVTSLYGHMSETMALVGQTVKPGDTVGLEDSTGHSTGPHVHFEIRVFDVPVDPRTFMVGNPAT